MKAMPPISKTMMTLPVLAVRRLGIIVVIWDDPNCGITLPSQSNAPANRQVNAFQTFNNPH